MLTRIAVDGFKSLHGVGLPLSNLNIVFGPNAAGKSNLLEAILLLSRVGTLTTLSQAFEKPLRGLPVEYFAMGSGGLPAMLRADNATLSLEADLLLPRQDGGAAAGPAPAPVSPAEAYRYRTTISVRPATGALAVEDEFFAKLARGPGLPHAGKLPRIERDGDQFVIRPSVRGHPSSEAAPRARTICSDLHFSGSRYPELDSLRGELSSWRMYYLDPREAMREPQPPRQVDDIGPRGETLAPFLYRLKQEHPKRLDAVRRTLQRAIPSVSRLDVDLDERRGVLTIEIDQDGVSHSSRVISEGTLRVLALCALASNPWTSSLIGFEEPENGVHPRRLEVIADLLVAIATRSGQQMVVTTHSPQLIAAMYRRKEQHAHAISLIAAGRDGRSSTFRRVDPGDLFLDPTIRAGLRSDDDIAATFESLMTHGLLDA